LGGVVEVTHPADRLDVTLDVVCDKCNTTWMSELSNEAKAVLASAIRQGRPRDFNQHELLTLAAFAFLKSAVMDWSVQRT
jgi:hypothetical protein